jgi:hypothetical protein
MRSFTIEIVYEGFKLRVKGTVSPYIPAKTNCLPEDSHPAEGGLEEINEVNLLDDKGNIINLPNTLQDYLENEIDIDDTVQEELDAIESEEVS